MTRGACPRLQEGARRAHHLEWTHSVDAKQPKEIICRERVEVAMPRGMLGGARTINEGVKPSPIGRSLGYSATVSVVCDVALHDAHLGAYAPTGVGSRLRFGATRRIVDDYSRALARDTYRGSSAQSVAAPVIRMLRPSNPAMTYSLCVHLGRRYLDDPTRH